MRLQSEDRLRTILEAHAAGRPAASKEQLVTAATNSLTRLNAYEVENRLDRAALRLVHRLASAGKERVTARDLRSALPAGVPEDQVRMAAGRLALKGLLLEVGHEDWYVPHPVMQALAFGNRPASLKTCLEFMPAEKRRQLAKNLGLKPVGSGDHGVLPSLFALLSDRASVLAIADRLSPDARELLERCLAAGGQISLAEAVSGAAKAHRKELRQRWQWGYYGDWQVTNELEELQSRGLLYVPFGAYTPAFAIPSETLACLPQPPEDPAPFCLPSLVISQSDEPFLEHTGILADVVRTLVFVEQERPGVLKSGGFPKQARKRLAQRLSCREDDYDGFVLALLFGLKLVEARGGRFLPAAEVDAWLSLDRAAQLSQLCRSWIGSRDWHEGEYDAFALDLFHYGGAPAIRMLLPALCRELPAEGATIESFAAVIEFDAPRAVMAAEQNGVWTMVLVQLVQALRWLGLAQTAGGDELAIRPGWALAHVLDGLKAPEPARELIVQPNLEIIGPPTLHLPLLRQLLRFTEASPVAGAVVAKLTTPSVRNGVECDLTAESMLAFLEQHAAKGVPQTVVHFIRDVAGQYGEIEIGPAEAYLKTATPELLAELLGDRTLKGRLRPLSATVALLAEAQQAKVVAAIKKRGKLPRVIERPPSPSPTARRASAYDEWLYDDDFETLPDA